MNTKATWFGSIATGILAIVAIATFLMQMLSKNESDSMHEKLTSQNENKLIIENKNKIINNSLPEIKSTERANIVTAKGVGLIDTEIKNTQQRVFLAKRAAKVDAMRQLTEMIHGSMTSSNTELKNGKLLKDEVFAKAQALLKSARVIREKRNEETIEITMEAPLEQ